MTDFPAKVESLVGKEGLVDAEQAVPILEDRRGYYRGRARMIVRPKTTAEVSALVALCHHDRVPVVPQGGNTGLCGGATPGESGTEVVLCLSRMDAIREIDTANQTATVEAGVVLQRLTEAVTSEGLMFPLDLGARGSCQIGGNLSTNAGGINVLRYGNIRDLVTGLEVVLPDGVVWHGLSKLRKDNTGYDLKQLFIGAEGTLGIITAAVVKLVPLPRQRHTAFVAVKNPRAATDLLVRVRDRCPDSLVSFEYIPRLALELIESDPLDGDHQHYVLCELTSHREGPLQEVLAELLDEGMRAGEILDGTMAQTDVQREALWRIRESISPAQRESVKNDISVPVSSVAVLLERVPEVVARIAPDARPCPFGHIGDGNIHYNILGPVGVDPLEFRENYGSKLIEAVNDLVISLGGSFSAEHGVGQLKRDDMCKYKDPVELQLMQRIKAALDPDQLMNPGKVV